MYDEPYDVVEHQLALLFRRARAVSRGLAEQVHPGLNPATYGLLLRLDETGGARLTDLSAYLGVGKPSLSRQVRLLQKLGLVRRDGHPGDRRAAVLVLTDFGRERLAAVRKHRLRQLRDLLAPWPAADVAELGRLLRKLNQG
jgi:DNA-binding MarR family transcriptional regulator